MSKIELIKLLEIELDSEFKEVPISKIDKSHPLAKIDIRRSYTEQEICEYSIDENKSIIALSINNKLSTIPKVLLNNKSIQETLEYLNLESNSIKRIKGLRNFKNIKHLNLSNNKLHSTKEIRKLPKLTYLDLSNNYSIEGFFGFSIFLLGNIEKLKVLKLNNLNLSRFGLITYPKNLKFLELGGNNISDIDALKNCENLIELDLSDNTKIKDFKVLNNLTKLKRLSLNNLEDFPYNIDNLSNFPHLEHLSMENSRVDNISVLQKLKELKSINLARNIFISDISSLSNLYQLHHINLRSNVIVDINSLKDLVNLTYLNISRNQISDVSILNNNKKLQVLDLSHNKISGINLNLNNLVKLELSNNHITNIDFVEKFVNLKKLNLSDNLISNLLPLNKLVHLNELTLYYNRITNLKQIEPIISNPTISIHIDGNPIIFPYLSNTKDINDVNLRGYILDALKLKVAKNNSKVILLGSGGVGKTSFKYRLIKNNKILPDITESTKGIDIFQWKINYNQKEIIVNIWEFGGQDIYKNLHELFLTNQTLYIIIIDTRSSFNDLEYWLEIIQHKRNSKCLIIVNQIDDREIQIPINNIVKDYNIPKEDIWKFNFAIDDVILNQLIEKIKTIVNDLVINVTDLEITHLNKYFEQNITTVPKYTLVNEWKTITQNIEALIDKLSILGLILKTTSYVYFSTQSVLNIFYKFIESKEIVNNNGYFSLNNIDNVFSNPVDIIIANDIITLMSFHNVIIYNKNNEYFIPQLLKELNNLPTNNKEISILYEYNPKLPQRLFWDIISKVNNLGNDYEVWRNGLIIKVENKQIKILVEIWKNQLKVIIPYSQSFKQKYIIKNLLNDIHNTYNDLIIKEYTDLPDTLLKELLEQNNVAGFRHFFELINEKLQSIDYILFAPKLKKQENRTLAENEKLLLKELLREQYFQLAFISIILSHNISILSEISNLKGRLDCLIELEQTYYLFELKYNKNSSIALKQILENKYFNNSFILKDRTIYLFGVNFCETKRSIDEICFIKYDSNVHLDINNAEIIKLQ